MFADTTPWETIVLSAAMSRTEDLNTVLELLGIEHFNDSRHILIYDAIRTLAQRGPVSAKAVALEIKKGGAETKAGGWAYIAGLAEKFDPSLDTTAYCHELRNAYSKLQIYNSLEGIKKECLNPIAVADDIAAQAHDALADYNGNATKHSRTLSEVIQDFSGGQSIGTYYTDIARRIKAGENVRLGLSTGFPTLDRLIGGLHPSTVNIIGGRPGFGKTTLLMNIMHNILSQNADAKLCIVSLEMPAEQLVRRYMCMRADVSFDKLVIPDLTEEEAARLLHLEPSMSKMGERLFIEDGPMTISEIRARVKRLIANHGVNVVLIDYLTRIKSDTRFSNNHLQVDEISKGLQNLAQGTGVAVVCLAQLNRALTQRANQRPLLSDFRESGSIEEDADVCMLLDRPAQWKEGITDDVTVIEVAKNRHVGKYGSVKLSFRHGVLVEQVPIEELAAQAAATPSRW